ncbi:hypothetical protein [Magnetospirillum sulfuroxidans]|uniref:HAMP domain-containing protein n=1 Tax=Magnetospirillum sulfuroxidans TaxID=611300 RepID=A0ABS5IA38_9PROT|nr:hypothetical protein [Magnetospirillum sulfuroxidans]MBR9971265.1 hypothetical protein [Magnetospirillum sulfuroxidans]
MSWSLARKVSAALIAILVSTMMVMSLFGFFKFEEVMSSLVRSRYSFVAFTIKKKVEDSLNLGFALRQLRQVQETIELEKARDEQIQGIEIYDARGEILFNSDRGRIGASVPETWLDPLTATSSQPFALMDEDSNVVGLPLVNNLGKVEGAVVLLYPSGYVERELGAMLGRLALEIGGLVVGFSLLTLVVASLALRPVRRRLAAMEAGLDRALMKDGDVAIAGLGDLGEFDGQFDEFVGKTREAIEHIKTSTDEVERLDRLA